jgi:hypothetical protein
MLDPTLKTTLQAATAGGISLLKVLVVHVEAILTMHYAPLTAD